MIEAGLGFVLFSLSAWFDRSWFTLFQEFQDEKEMRPLDSASKWEDIKFILITISLWFQAASFSIPVFLPTDVFLSWNRLSLCNLWPHCVGPRISWPGRSIGVGLGGGVPLQCSDPATTYRRPICWLGNSSHPWLFDLSWASRPQAKFSLGLLFCSWASEEKSAFHWLVYPRTHTGELMGISNFLLIWLR